MPSSIRTLTERRIPQVLAIYLGAAFGVVQFVDFVGSRYLLPSVWTDITLLSMALLLPSVLLYTYHHGQPGRDEWQRSEKIVIPANLLLLLVVVTMVGAGTPLSATGHRITVTDEQGNQREAVVPDKAYRKRVAFFMFDSPNDSATKWLRFGMPQMAWQDLLQQNFIEVMPPIYLREGLARKGFAAGVDVPLSLKRDVVSELHVPHFVTGRIEKTGNEYVATVQIYETETGRLINERTLRAADATQLADQMSVGLIEDLEIPVLADSRTDMPVAEILSKDTRALRAYVDASAALQMENDFPRAAQASAEAVRLDPTFAGAHLLQYVVASYSNNSELAQSAVQKAMDHSYRLPERLQELVKVDYYMLKQDYQRAFAVLDMLAQLYPEDIQVQQTLMVINTIRDDKDAIIATARKILELDPTRTELILQLAELHQQKGDVKAAFAAYEEYATRYPGEARSHRNLGNLHRRMGAHAAARAAYEKALLVGPNDVETLVEFSTLERELGDFAAAEQKARQAYDAAKTPDERLSALRGLSALQEFRGALREAQRNAEAALAEAAKSEPPAMILLRQLMMIGDQARFDMAGAQAQLAQMRASLKPPLDMYLPIAELAVYLELEDVSRSEQAVNAMDAMVKRTNIKSMAPLVLHGRARVLELRNDCKQAIPLFRQAGQADPLDVTTSVDVGRCYRKLGQRSEAIAELNKVLAVMPAHGQANLQLGLVYQEAGDVAGARKHLEQALRTWAIADPAYKPAQKAKAALTKLR